MEYEKIIDLIHEIESSSITDFALQKGEFRISIKKEGTKEPKAEADRTIDIEEREMCIRDRYSSKFLFHVIELKKLEEASEEEKGRTCTVGKADCG